MTENEMVNTNDSADANGTPERPVDAAALAESTTLEQYISAGGCHDSLANNRILAALIEREVLHCISSTVQFAAATTELHEACELDYDDVHSLLSQPCWTESAVEHLASKMTRSEMIAWLEERDVEGSFDTMADVDVSHAVMINIDNCEQFCSDQGVDIIEDEAYEHWAVTEWMRDALKEEGAITGDLLDFNVWGRTTTGQSIRLDRIIKQVAAKMKILAGQKYSWDS